MAQVTPIINKKDRSVCTELFTHSQELPPVDINPFSSLHTVIHLVLSLLGCYSFSLLSSQSSPMNLFQLHLPHVSQLQLNSSRCAGPRSRVILESFLSPTSPQFFSKFCQLYLQNRFQIQLLLTLSIAITLAQATSHLLSGLLKWPPGLTPSFYPCSPSVCSLPRSQSGSKKTQQIRSCHSSAPSCFPFDSE